MNVFKIMFLFFFFSQFLSGCSEQSPQQIRTRAWLQYFPGNAQGVAVVRLTLFPSENGNGLQYEELRRSVDKEQKEHFIFDVLTDGQRARLENVQEHQKVLKTKQQNSDLLELVILYSLEPGAKPPPGSCVTMSCSSPHLQFVSNTVKIPATAPDELLALQREVRVCDLLQDRECLQNISRTMLRQYPSSFASYWFASIAYEQAGNIAEALSILETGHQYLPNPDESTSATGHIDISSGIFRRITALDNMK